MKLILSALLLFSSYAFALNPGPLSIKTQSGNYPAVLGDDLILESGAVANVTLYTASGNTGRMITIRKTDSSLTNIITVAGFGAETIDGVNTTTLNTQYESIQVVSDGTNWQILNRRIPSKWNASFAPTVTNFGTVSSNTQMSRRVGGNIEVVGTFTSGVSVSSEAQVGIGFLAAGDVTIDTSTLASQIAFYLFPSDAQLNKYWCVSPVSDQTYFNITDGFASSSQQTIHPAGDIEGTGQSVHYHCIFPIKGWKG